MAKLKIILHHVARAEASTAPAAFSGLLARLRRRRFPLRKDTRRAPEFGPTAPGVFVAAAPAAPVAGTFNQSRSRSRPSFDQ